MTWPTDWLENRDRGGGVSRPNIGDLTDHRTLQQHDGSAEAEEAAARLCGGELTVHCSIWVNSWTAHTHAVRGHSAV